MKVLAINGSPNKKGNTYHALKIVTDQLDKQGFETEILHLGKAPIRGCTACGICAKKKNEKCIFDDDIVNEGIQKIKEADGLLLGSPVHFAAMSGAMKSFLDRAFYVQGSNSGLFRHKVGAAISVVRRSGEIPTFNQLTNYLHYAEMMIPSGNYWNSIHGRLPGEVLEDKEGVQIMEVLANNMAWLLNMIDKSDIPAPPRVEKEWTHFIR